MRRSYVRLLELDLGLATGLDPEARREARRLAVAPLITLPAGHWRGEQLIELTGGTCHLGCLVADGLIIHEFILDGRGATLLLGKGDFVLASKPPGALAGAQLHFSVAEKAAIAVMDESFQAVTARWPAIAAALLERAQRQAERSALHQAISQLPRAEQRIVALFWHLGERWGTVEDDHMIVPVSLGHETIARLIGGRRPTITAALTRLTASGLLVREPDGAWLLAVESRRLLNTTPHPSPTGDAHLLPSRGRFRPTPRPGVPAN